MIEHKRLGDVLDGKGIFTRIMTAHEVPWNEDTTITGELLDFEYIYNQSGDKIISPAVEKNLEDDELGTTQFNKLCDVAYMMYNKRWARLWEILTAEFNPLQNYDMSESRTINYGKIDTNSGTDTTLRTGTDTHAESGTNTLLMTGTDTHAESGKDTVKNTGTDNVVKSGSEATVKTGSTANVKTGSESDAHTGGYTDTSNNLATEHEVSAFNSSGYSDASKDTTTGSNQRTYNSDTNTHTYTSVTDTTTNNNLTDTSTYNNVTNAETKNLQDETTYGHQDQETRNMSDATTFGHQDQETRNMTDALTHGHVQTASGRDTETLTRSGNIGVTTSQQMAQSSLDLWKWNYFYDIFRDIDSVFTIATY